MRLSAYQLAAGLGAAMLVSGCSHVAEFVVCTNWVKGGSDHACQAPYEWRRERDRAEPRCDAGDPEACATVGAYDLAHDREDELSVSRVTLACNRGAAVGCAALGMFEEKKRQRSGSALFVRGCRLGHVPSCEMALARVPSRSERLEMARRACELDMLRLQHGGGEHCYRLAALLWSGGGAELAEARRLLGSDCAHLGSESRACAILGRLDAGLSPAEALDPSVRQSAAGR